MELSTQKPIYFLIMRALQTVLGLIVLILAACFIYGASTSEIVWALICGLFTIGVAVANIIARRIPHLISQPIYLILLVVDALFIIFWLAAMAANARLLGLLKVPVACKSTYNNGQAINSNYCVVKRTNYNLVVNPTGKGIIGAIIALSVLQLALFAAVLGLALLDMRRSTAPAPGASELARTGDGAPDMSMQQHQLYDPPMSSTPAPYPQQVSQQVSPAQPYEPQPYQQHQSYAQQQPYQYEQPYAQQQQHPIPTSYPQHHPYQHTPEQQYQTQPYQSNLVPLPLQHRSSFPDRNVSPLHEAGVSPPLVQVQVQPQPQVYYPAPPG